MKRFSNLVYLNQTIIDELVNYDHTDRPDLIKIAYDNIKHNLDENFIESWEQWITNPLNMDNKYKYKIYVPYSLPTFISSNTPSSYLDKTIKNNDQLPLYKDIYSEYNSSDDESVDIYDDLIFPIHVEDLIKFGISYQYKAKIRNDIMTIMKRQIQTLLDEYDTTWLELDNYTLKSSVKIKYDYVKNKSYGKFTGIIITLKLSISDESKSNNKLKLFLNKINHLMKGKTD